MYLVQVLFRGIPAIVIHQSILAFSQPFPEQINAKQKLFFNSDLYLGKKSFHHCVYILSRNREKQLCN
jgi:hypothetical protein